MTRVTRVVQNINSFERELSRYGYDVICRRYHDNQYDAMYRAFTTTDSVKALKKTRH